MLRRLSVTALVAAVIVAAPSYAAKRRAVSHPGPGVPISVPTLTGVVLDASTGQPVRAMTVYVGTRITATNAQGRFELKNTSGVDALILQTDRSGYLPFSTRVGANDPKDITIRVTPTPAVSVHRTDGQIVTVDLESFKFGYPVPFSGYRDSEYEDFCKADGTKLSVHRTQFKRIAGPAALVGSGPCCPAGNAARMTVTLRTGETSDLFFTDTCEGRYNVDLGARDHLTGEFVHIPITEITEIVFP
ncbi:MAG: hypothetical protein ABI779_09325 [Acidobacteriota bacterium]